MNGFFVVDDMFPNEEFYVQRKIYGFRINFLQFFAGYKNKKDGFQRIVNNTQRDYH